jgi:CMP-N,N'-diacetyllegionaminic acid synthase
MHQESEILAIITARGGSKGVPKKNIRPLNGKPLIAYSIEAAKRSRYIDRVVISTDSEEIADIAVLHGAEILFLRPAQYSTDESPVWEAIVHALQWIEEHERKTYSTFCLLQPTSPFRKSQHIDCAFDKFFSVKTADSLISICESSKSPFWSQIISSDGLLHPLIESKEQYNRRQDLPKTYDINGAIYISKTEFYRRMKSFLKGKTTFFVMERDSSLDIDTELDFIVADAICLQKSKNESQNHCTS